MITRIIGPAGLALLVLGLLAGPASCAAPRYAVAAGQNTIYLLGTNGADWGGSSHIPLVTIPGATISGLAVEGNLIFAADVAANALRIYRVQGDIATNPETVLVNTVSLSGGGSMILSEPGAIAVTAAGGVFVLGRQWEDNEGMFRYTYAYVDPVAPGNWAGAATVSIIELANSPLVDVAAFGSGSGAVIAHQRIGGGQPPGAEAGSTYVTRRIGAATTGITRLLDENKPVNERLNHAPQSIAVHPDFGVSGYAYVLNRRASDDPETGSLSVVNTDTLSLVGPTLVLPNRMLPQDISVFSLSDNGEVRNYLAIVGVADGIGGMRQQQAWRIELGSNGLPDMGTLTEYFLNSADQSVQHHLASSLDGKITWMTNTEAQTVIALDNTASVWDQVAGGRFEIKDTIREVKAFVPEPSGLAALALLAGGGAVALRRRR